MEPIQTLVLAKVPGSTVCRRGKQEVELQLKNNVQEKFTKEDIDGYFMVNQSSVLSTCYWEAFSEGT